MKAFGPFGGDWLGRCWRGGGELVGGGGGGEGGGELFIQGLEQRFLVLVFVSSVQSLHDEII